MEVGGWAHHWVTACAGRGRGPGGVRADAEVQRVWRAGREKPLSADLSIRSPGPAAPEG